MSSPKHNYYNKENVDWTGYVNYEYLDKDKKSLSVFNAKICFRDYQFKEGVPTELAFIRHYRSLTQVCYDWSALLRFTKILNSAHHPCKVSFPDGEHVSWMLDLSLYKSKAHVCSCLSLHRMSFEGGQATMLEDLLRMLDEKPSMDPVEAISTVLVNPREGSYVNTNHTASFSGQGVTTSAKLLAKLPLCQTKVAESGRGDMNTFGVHNLWLP